jgi:hypothetical protein
VDFLPQKYARGLFSTLFGLQMDGRGESAASLSQTFHSQIFLAVFFFLYFFEKRKERRAELLHTLLRPFLQGSDRF